MSILCLTGWQQPADALQNIAPDATHFDYDAYDDVMDCYRALAALPTMEVVVGWSLGACLAIPAVMHGLVKAKKLVLLAPQYQYIADEEFPEGMARSLADETREFYFTDPQKMVMHLNQLIARGDRYERDIIRRHYTKPPKLWRNGMFWLQQLEKFSVSPLDLSGLPETHIIQGDMDVIAPNAHGEALHRVIPTSELHIWEACAHAPHLHDADGVERIVHS